MLRNKTYSVILLVLVMGAHVFKIPCIYLDYQLRKDFIAANLCEEKDQEITMCYGSCYLQKQLKDTQEEGQGNTPETKRQLPQEYCNAIDLEIVSRTYFTLKKQFFDYPLLYTLEKGSAIFHPPRLG